MARGFEPLHAPLPLTRRAMRVLTPIIEIAALAMFRPGQYLALGSPIAFELVGHDDTRHIREALEQLAKELLGRLLVATALHQDIEDVVVLIHRPPQVMARTIDR